MPSRQVAQKKKIHKMKATLQEPKIPKLILHTKRTTAKLLYFIEGELL